MEYLTVGANPAELKSYEIQLRRAGFRKRRNGYGQSPNTGQWYQWWDRKGSAKRSCTIRERRRKEGSCIRCGNQAVESVRGGFSQYCEPHRERNRAYMKDYMRRRKKEKLTC